MFAASATNRSSRHHRVSIPRRRGAPHTPVRPRTTASRGGTQTMKMRFATPALLMVGVLAFAACGGDDDSGGSVLGRSSTTKEQSGGASSSATTKATSGSSDDSASTSSDATDDTTDSGVTVDTNFSGKGSKDFCNYLKDAKNEVEDLNLGEDSSPSDLKKSFQ